MGKWTCKCGNILSDHKYPDEKIVNKQIVYKEMGYEFGEGEQQIEIDILHIKEATSISNSM